MTRFRLSGVLRARQAQEDVAKAEVVRARVEAQAAASGVRARGRDLDGRLVPDAATGAAFAAAMSARQALASALCAAVGVAQLADGTLAQRLDELTESAVQRRTIEKLAERHAAARKRIDDSAEAKAVDDLTTTAAHRRPAGFPPAR